MAMNALGLSGMGLIGRGGEALEVVRPNTPDAIGRGGWSDKGVSRGRRRGTATMGRGGVREL